MGYNRFKNYTPLKYIILLGALIVVTTDWGSMASWITLGFVIITGILFPFIRWAWKQRLPFKATYKIDTFREAFTAKEIDTQTLPQEEWIYINKGILLEGNCKYSIYLDLIPKVSWEISRIEARFEINAENRPKVLFLQDLTPPSTRLTNPYKRPLVGESAITYNPFVPIAKNGKAIDCLVNIQTFNRWEGNLSLRFEFANVGVRYLKIRTRVN